MREHRTRGLAALVLAVAVLAGCGRAHGGATAASAPAATLSAKAHAEATSSGGEAIKKTAAQVADACRPPGGWNDMYPGVTGASQARQRFISCEKIPRRAVFAWGVCIGKAYGHAPRGGAAGTPPENTRQAFLATAFGQCTKTARAAA